MGCGIEFNQPAIIVEALALTAVHAKRTGTLLTEAENLSNARGKSPNRSLVDIVHSIHADETIRASQSWTEPNKFENGPIQKASTQLQDYAAQWNVGEGQLKEKMAELINATGKHLTHFGRRYINEYFL